MGSAAKPKAGRRFGRYWGKSRDGRMGSKTTRMTHRVSRPSFTALRKGLSDQFVGAAEQRRRHCECQAPRGLKIDDKREFGRLHDRRASGLGSPEGFAKRAAQDRDCGLSTRPLVSCSSRTLI
jgi:hypothetical protein